MSGTDLASPYNVWPSLIAQRLNMEYECCATPGGGNLQIMESILQRVFDPTPTIYVINWTWIDRFDYIYSENGIDYWKTLRPSLDNRHAEYYFRHLHSQYRDILTNLVYIKTALGYLLSNHHRFIMTSMDRLLHETIKVDCHDAQAVTRIQNSVLPYLDYFPGEKNFLDWSKDNDFPISPTWHPLEKAHTAAADYFIDAIRRIA